MGLDTCLAEGFQVYHVGGGVGGGGGGGGMVCSCCRRRGGPAVGFGMYHAGGGMFRSCCNGQNSSPWDGCYQTEVGGMKNAKSSPSGVVDCHCRKPFCSS